MTEIEQIQPDGTRNKTILRLNQVLNSAKATAKVIIVKQVAIKYELPNGLVIIGRSLYSNPETFSIETATRRAKEDALEKLYTIEDILIDEVPGNDIEADLAESSN